jgi:hypothetical protein
MCRHFNTVHPSQCDACREAGGGPLGTPKVAPAITAAVLHGRVNVSMPLSTAQMLSGRLTFVHPSENDWRPLGELYTAMRAAGIR